MNYYRGKYLKAVKVENTKVIEKLKREIYNSNLKEFQKEELWDYVENGRRLSSYWE